MRELTKEEKIELLKNYFADEVIVKAIKDLFTTEELDKWLDMNLEVLLQVERI